MTVDTSPLDDGATYRIKDVLSLLKSAERRFSPVALASSMGAEDMVLIDIVARNDLSIGVFVLDTGRLHSETYGLIQEIRAHYELPIKVFSPTHEALEQFMAAHGPNGFYDSIEARKACCAIRKVEPLGRALAGYGSWVTGMRREQSITRAELALEEWDGRNGLQKFNPLADWSSDDVWTYIRANEVPYNPLHDSGFPSIGCAPCTRAVAPGDDPRSGRWWWEDAEERECGLHVKD